MHVQFILSTAVLIDIDRRIQSNWVVFYAWSKWFSIVIVQTYTISKKWMCAFFWGKNEMNVCLSLLKKNCLYLFLRCWAISKYEHPNSWHLKLEDNHGYQNQALCACVIPDCRQLVNYGWKGVFTFACFGWLSGHTTLVFQLRSRKTYPWTSFPCGGTEIELKLERPRLQKWWVLGAGKERVNAKKDDDMTCCKLSLLVAINWTVHT